MTAIEITESEPPTDAAAVASFETAHGLQLPEAYRAFLLRHNGGRPRPNGFRFGHFDDDPIEGIHFFFGLGAESRVYDLAFELELWRGRIPAGILPVACTEGVDLICLDLRRTGAPVAFWDFVPFWGDNVWNEADLHPVAPSFTAFLETLENVPDERASARLARYRAANRAAGLAQTPKGYVWHAHQDGVTMQLVPREVHRLTGCSGAVG